MESFGQRLRTRRIETGASVQAITGSLGITNAAYYNYETGLSSPNADTIDVLCRLLGCDANYLFGYEKNSSGWSQVGIKIGSTVSNFPEVQQQIALYVVNGIKLQIDAYDTAEQSKKINNGKLDLSFM